MLTLQTFYKEIKSLDWQNSNLLEEVDIIAKKYLNNDNLDALDKAKIEGFVIGYRQMVEEFINSK